MKKQDKDKQEFFRAFDYLGRDYQPLNPDDEYDYKPERIEEVWQWIESKKAQWQREAIKNCAELVQTHTEHEGKYCDTGADMEWWCRSECTSMAVDRLRTYYKNLTSPTNQDE